jgi:hypothetical protein
MLTGLLTHVPIMYPNRSQVIRVNGVETREGKTDDLHCAGGEERLLIK